MFFLVLTAGGGGEGGKRGGECLTAECIKEHSGMEKRREGMGGERKALYKIVEWEKMRERKAGERKENRIEG